MADVRVQTFDSTGGANRTKSDADGIDLGQEGILSENLTSDPSTPASNHVKSYFKADRLHQIDDTGAVHSFNRSILSTVSTTDATVTTLASIPITTDTINYVEAKVLARISDGDGSAYELRARIKDKAGTTTAHDVTQLFVSEDSAGMEATIDVSGTNARVIVTGIAATNIDWSVKYGLETLA